MQLLKARKVLPSGDSPPTPAHKIPRSPAFYGILALCLTNRGVWGAGRKLRYFVVKSEGNHLALRRWVTLNHVLHFRVRWCPFPVWYEDLPRAAFPLTGRILCDTTPYNFQNRMFRPVPMHWSMQSQDRVSCPSATNTYLKLTIVIIQESTILLSEITAFLSVYSKQSGSNVPALQS